MRTIGITFFALLSFTTLASAQSIAANAPATSIELVSGVMDFDFQGWRVR